MIIKREKYLNKLRETLPAIKIPSHIIYMKKFPLTASGKLDEMKLREISLQKLITYLDEKQLVSQTKKLMKERKEKKHR